MLKKILKKMFLIMIIIIALIATYIIVINYVIFNEPHRKKGNLEVNITEYINENYTEESMEILLSDFTTFEWDKVFVFQNYVSKEEIEYATGIEYEKSLGFAGGVIFIYENKIVYEEFYPTTFDTPPLFIIYPYSNINEIPFFRVFVKEEALFKSKIFQLNNENYYMLYPSN